MSKVNSFKCDICGEVYHVTEGVSNEFITIHKHCVSADEGEVTSYKHICPTCEYAVRKLIENPAIIDEKEKALGDTRAFNVKLKSLINSIHRSVFGWSSCCTVHDPVTEYENDAVLIKDEIRDKKRQINELSDVRNGLVERVNKQLWAIRILSCLLGMCLGSALVQIIF